MRYRTNQRFVVIVAGMALALFGCDLRHKANTRAEPDAGPVTKATTTASAVVFTAETAPSFAPAPVRPPSPPTHKLDDVVTLEGVFNPPEEEGRDEKDDTACADAIRLASPLRVLKEDGREAEAGGTKRVCVWHWEGQSASDKKPAPHMLQKNSRVIVRGKLTPRIRSHHPNAILLFDTVVVSAGPPSTQAPPDVLPEGQSFAYVRKVDVAMRTMTLDLAYVFYGDEAKRAAAARGGTYDPAKDWFVVNDSAQLRTIRLPAAVYPKQLKTENGGGWVTLDLSELERDSKVQPGRAFFVTIKEGVVTAIDEVNLR
jgi:hypothetical protein